MPSMDIGIEVSRGEDAGGEVVLSVDFTFRAGSPAHYGDLNYPGHPAEPPEVEIKTILWPYDRRRRADEAGEGRWVRDHHELPPGLLPGSVYDALEQHICDHYNPADDGPDY